MISKINSNKLIYRDGTSQQDRYQDPLHAEYVQVEDRSIEELIREAQRLAKEIQFFDEQDNAVSNWEALWIDDVEAYSKKTETEKEIQRKRWAKQLAEYVENPESFQGDSEKLAKLSRPHVVLFITFLKLLNHVKSQINGLTKKHLDFYFLERLGFKPKDAVPDVVHVLLELVTDMGQLEVKKGTTLLAGNDEDGNELQYTTDQDTVISEAKITQLKTVFVEKSTLSIKDAHHNHMDDEDNGLTKMMEMALGNPNPGDPLSPLPNEVENLIELYELLKQDATVSQEYVIHHLFLTVGDFKRIIETHLKSQDTLVILDSQEWQEVYFILDQAFKSKTKKKRQFALKELRESDEVNGFDKVLKQVYGHPQAGDELPLYKGNTASVLTIYDDLENNNQEALNYIVDELYLSEKDFIKLVVLKQNPEAASQDWDEMDEILEQVNRKVRSITLLSPVREELFNIYAEPDALASAFSLYGEEEESVRFKTLGGKQAGIDQLLKPANIGFAISSPIFLLQEGRRQITTMVAFDSESGDMENIKTLFSLSENNIPPFKVYVTSEKEWMETSHSTFLFGDYVMGVSESIYEGGINSDVMSMTSGDDFTNADIGKYLVWTDGTIYEIKQIKANDTVTVARVGNTDVSDGIRKYKHNQLYLNSLKVIVELQEGDLPLVPIDPAVSNPFIHSEFPSLVFSLNHVLVEQQSKQSYFSHYQELMHLKMDKVHIHVDVQGMRTMTLQNDQSTIDAKKPFEPFGDNPEIGNSFYLANTEISHKKLDHLQLDAQWMKGPDEFTTYYQNYWKIEADDPNLPISSYTIQSDDDFKAKVFLADNRAEIEIGEIGLFSDSGKINMDTIPQHIQSSSPSYSYKSEVDYSVEEDVLDWDRYFKLELSHQDFQQSVYNGLFRKQALSKNPEITKLSINPPYIPKFKSLKVGYSSQTEMIIGEMNAVDHEQFYHLHPFGYKRLKTDNNPYLLPEYNHEGELYLGIEKLEKPQTLSILFQMSEGSANPEVEKPKVQWSYLKDNEWNLINDSAILSDTTNGLLNTGIIQIDIPSEATNGDTLLPDQLNWLRASCDHNIAGVSDTVNIVTQAISATFSSKEVAPSHFVDLLHPQSITETQEPSAGIKTITQPYTSSKGKPAEKDAIFYNRISERLRHKNRALTMWDYERMVLDQFPEVYKVKCVPGNVQQNNSQIGAVNVMVIPDIKGKLPFNPFEPKVPTDTLFQIQQFLDAQSPVYAEVAVSNPTYLQIKTRCVVKFNAGYNAGFYKPKLVDELKRFLAPWAYDKGGNMTIGGSIYASVIINFIAERPYIDYVANMKLFQSEDGKQFIDVRSLNDGENKVIATRSDTVLVSAQTHEIDIVDENGYNEDNFEGINYMKVELDFQIGEDVLSS